MSLTCAQAKPKFAQLLIPTVDSVRYEYLLALVLSVQKARLSTGFGIPAPVLFTIAEVLWICMCMYVLNSSHCSPLKYAGHYGTLLASCFNLLAIMRDTLQASLLVGGPGTAKTSTINQFLSRFSTEEMASKTVTFSSLTTPFIFQQAMEARPKPAQEVC